MEASLHVIEAESAKVELQHVVESGWNQNSTTQRVEAFESMVLETEDITKEIHYTIDASAEQIRAGGGKNGHAINPNVLKSQNGLHERQRRPMGNFDEWKRKCKEFDTNWTPRGVSEA